MTQSLPAVVATRWRSVERHVRRRVAARVSRGSDPTAATELKPNSDSSSADGDYPDPARPLRLILNGQSLEVEVPHGTMLADLLREHGARSVKRSCDVQMCGSCSVLVDGLPVSSCCYLAMSAESKSVQTVEGLRVSGDGRIYAAIEDAFIRAAGVQCGFCTPGFVVLLWFLIENGVIDSNTTDGDLRHYLRGNLCRCTGYESILEAARAAVRTHGGSSER